MTRPIEYLDVVERGEIVVEDERHVSALLALGPEFEERQYFAIRVRRGKFFLTAGKYVGIIPIGRYLVLRVSTKVSTTQLIQILTLAEQPPLLISLLERAYGQGSDLSMLELLVRAFHRELATLFRLGPIREYTRTLGEGQTVRGRALPGETISKFWPKASFDRVMFEYFDFSPQNHLNQALEYALWLSQRVYPKVSSNPDAGVMQDLSDAHQVFGSIQPDRSRAFLPSLRRHLQEKPSDEPFVSFRPLLTLSLMLLDEIGVNLESDSAADVDLAPMVVDMEEVFQNMLFHTLATRAKMFQGFECWDTAKSHQRPLLSSRDRSLPDGFRSIASNRPAKPDLTFALNGVPVIVGDAKYKSSRDIHDVYQAVAHAGAYGARDILLVYPTEGADKVIEFTSHGYIGDVGVFVCRFPLDSVDLESEADTLILAIHELVPSAARVNG
ncbi:McrC family protein [Salinibacterium sp. UTAS2018]|uniref:McrC family protein n=1 Tax=Salinibacterium sp. UTAS2018 TaxID=2508880 RepID=UPI00143D8010|nr:hypothetical protein [Salinibacterium sp. UTAS2018]